MSWPPPSPFLRAGRSPRAYQNPNKNKKASGWGKRQERLRSELLSLRAAGDRALIEQLEYQLRVETEVRARVSRLKGLGKNSEAEALMRQLNSVHGWEDQRRRQRCSPTQLQELCSRWHALECYCGGSPGALIRRSSSNVWEDSGRVQQSVKSIPICRSEGSIAVIPNIIYGSEDSPPGSPEVESRNALRELLHFLQSGESVEAVQFGIWQSFEGYFCDCISHSQQDRALSWEEALPLLDSDWSLTPADGSDSTYAVIIWTKREEEGGSGRVIRQYRDSQNGGRIKLHSTPRNPPPPDCVSTLKATIYGESGSWA